jgi:hypothetical protein
MCTYTIGSANERIAFLWRRCERVSRKCSEREVGRRRDDTRRTNVELQLLNVCSGAVDQTPTRTLNAVDWLTRLERRGRRARS